MNPSRSLVQRARTIAREQGPRGIAAGMRRILIRVRRLYLVEHPVEGCDEPEPPAGIAVRLLDAEGVPRLGNGTLAALLGPRLRFGDDVLVAERDGCVVGWIWIVHASPADDPDRLPVTIGEGEAFANGLTVLPEARRNGVATALLVARNARARALGARIVLSHVDSLNGAALALQHRFGATIRRELIVVHLLCRFRLVIERPPQCRAIPLPAARRACG